MMLQRETNRVTRDGEMSIFRQLLTRTGGKNLPGRRRPTLALNRYFSHTRILGIHRLPVVKISCLLFLYTGHSYGHGYVNSFESDKSYDTPR